MYDVKMSTVKRILAYKWKQGDLLVCCAISFLFLSFLYSEKRKDLLKIKQNLGLYLSMR